MNDVFGDPRNFDPNDPGFDWYNYDATWGAPIEASAPPAPSAPAPSGNPWGIPTNSNQPAGTMDLSYWLSRGVTPDQIFDANGQLKPGWQRTERGYEQTGPSGPQSPPTTDYPPTSGGGGGGYAGGGDGGYGVGDFGAGGPRYAAPPFTDWGSFDPGPAFSFREFSAPDPNNIAGDKGFQFRMDQGRKALEASAAGKGVLRSGGTLKDLLEYGQNFASHEYGNVFNRALQEYDVNRRNAWDSWNSGYGGRKDQYAFGADRGKAINDFNRNNAQFDFQSAFDTWSKEGDWLNNLAAAGLQS